MSLTFQGSGQSRMAQILLLAIVRPSAVIMYQRNSSRPYYGAICILLLLCTACAFVVCRELCRHVPYVIQGYQGRSRYHLDRRQCSDLVDL